jgi:signal transduction histidine kinase
MIAVVAHDLKNPLAVIQMSVQLLLQELLPNDSAHGL